MVATLILWWGFMLSNCYNICHWCRGRVLSLNTFMYDADVAVVNVFFRSDLPHQTCGEPISHIKMCFSGAAENCCTVCEKVSTSLKMSTNAGVLRKKWGYQTSAVCSWPLHEAQVYIGWFLHNTPETQTFFLTVCCELESHADCYASIDVLRPASALLVAWLTS